MPQLSSVDALLRVTQALTRQGAKEWAEDAQNWVGGAGAFPMVFQGSGCFPHTPMPDGQPLWLALADQWARVKPSEHYHLASIVELALKDATAPWVDGPVPLPPGVMPYEWPIVWLIEQQGADVSAAGNWAQDYHSVVEWAAQHASVGLFSYLLHHPQQRSAAQLMTLPVVSRPTTACDHLAGHLDSAEKLQALLEVGWRADHPDAQGRTPYATTLKSAHVAVLVAAGADPEQRGPQGEPPAWQLMKGQGGVKCAKAVVRGLTYRAEHGLDDSASEKHQRLREKLVHSALLAQVRAPAAGWNDTEKGQLKDAIKQQPIWTGKDGITTWGLLGAVVYQSSEVIGREGMQRDILSELLRPTVPLELWRHESMPGVPDILATYFKMVESEQTQPFNKAQKGQLRHALHQVYGTEPAFRQAVFEVIATHPTPVHELFFSARATLSASGEWHEKLPVNPWWQTHLSLAQQHDWGQRIAEENLEAFPKQGTSFRLTWVNPLREMVSQYGLAPDTLTDELRDAWAPLVLGGAVLEHALHDLKVDGEKVWRQAARSEPVEGILWRRAAEQWLAAGAVMNEVTVGPLIVHQVRTLWPEGQAMLLAGELDQGLAPQAERSRRPRF